MTATDAAVALDEPVRVQFHEDETGNRGKDDAAAAKGAAVATTTTLVQYSGGRNPFWYVRACLWDLDHAFYFTARSTGTPHAYTRYISPIVLTRPLLPPPSPAQAKPLLIVGHHHVDHRLRQGIMENRSTPETIGGG